MEAGPRTWRAYELVRHVNTPYSAIRCRTTLKPTGTGPKRASLEYIFAAALDASRIERAHGEVPACSCRRRAARLTWPSGTAQHDRTSSRRSGREGMDIRRAPLLIEHEFCVCGLATAGSDQENASDMGLKRHSSAGSLSAHRGYRSLACREKTAAAVPIFDTEQIFCTLGSRCGSGR
jgi:hypothetical protein